MHLTIENLAADASGVRQMINAARANAATFERMRKRANMFREEAETCEDDYERDQLMLQARQCDLAADRAFYRKSSIMSTLETVLPNVDLPSI